MAGREGGGASSSKDSGSGNSNTNFSDMFGFFLFNATLQQKMAATVPSSLYFVNTAQNLPYTGEEVVVRAF